MWNRTSEDRTTTTFVCACSLLDYCSLQVDGVLMTPFQCGAERLKIAAEKLFDSTQFQLYKYEQKSISADYQYRKI